MPGNDYERGLKARLRDGLDGRELKWLAEGTGVSYNQVQRYVNGSTAPPVRFVALYCEALPLLNPGWILLGDPEPKFRMDAEGLSMGDWLRALADRADREGDG
jgi:hypothetical protein